MAIIWGFNLSDMSWGAFRGRHMFDRRWHLRRERFIIYQLAMLIGLAAECTATYSLAKYGFHQTNIERLSGWTASVHNNDLIAAAVVTIVFCVFVATLFGADYFFLLFWPRRGYPGWYNRSKKGLAVFISAGMLAAALMSTIIVASHASYITGVSESTAQDLTRVYYRPPLVYRRFSTNIAWVVLLWVSTVSTFASTILMFIASAHDDRHGTEPKNIINLNGDSAGDRNPINDNKNEQSNRNAFDSGSEKKHDSGHGEGVDGGGGGPSTSAAATGEKGPSTGKASANGNRLYV